MHCLERRSISVSRALITIRSIVEPLFLCFHLGSSNLPGIQLDTVTTADFLDVLAHTKPSAKSLTQRYAAWQSEFESVWGHIYPDLASKKTTEASSLISVSKFTGRTENWNRKQKIYLEDWINLDNCTTLEVDIFMVNVSKILKILITGMCHAVETFLTVRPHKISMSNFL